jgi:hypothetical protein
MLVKHLRDGNNVPFATIVATSRDQIGVSICSTKDRFCRKMGTKVAAGRAAIDIGYLEHDIPNRNILVEDESVDGSVDYLSMEEIIDIEYLVMCDRARRYFKEN